MEDKKQMISENQQQQQVQEIVEIDEHWLHKAENKYPIDYSLLVCSVCYSIPIDSAVQCSTCQRVFCQRDYNIISHGDEDKCPNCSTSPWNISKQLHLLYRNMFSSLQFNCQMCKDYKIYKKEELIKHLLQIHNRYISQQSLLFQYSLVTKDGTVIKMNKIQNIEMNYKKKEGKYKFDLGGNQGRVITVNLQEMTAYQGQLGDCSIMKEKSNQLKRYQKYVIWAVNLADNHHIKDQRRLVFYSQNLQQLMQTNYDIYVKNEKMNEFHMDVRGTRFRISFKKNTQTNTTTQNMKAIQRLNITFK